MASVAVIDAGRVVPRVNPETGLAVRRTLGAQTGFDALEQAVLELEAGSKQTIDVGPAEETLFVVEGEGTVTVAGDEHALEPEVGVYLPPGSQFELHSTGAGPLRVVAVRDPRSRAGPKRRHEHAGDRLQAWRAGARSRDGRARVQDRGRPIDRPAVGDPFRRLHPDRARA